MIQSEILRHSINEKGDEIISFKVKMPRFIQSELLTHRMFARNSASSRAVPFSKMLEKVSKEPVIPISWMKNHKGMQGSSFFKDPSEKSELKRIWLGALDSMKESASSLNKEGLTKQISNRLLEPFLYSELIITATDLDNFFSQRLGEGTEIHFRDLAVKMLASYRKSTPTTLNSGEYHLPFYSKEFNSLSIFDKIKVSVARCARVSYYNFNGNSSFDDDFRLYDWLVENQHWSPFEHVCRSMSSSEYNAYSVTRTPSSKEDSNCEVDGIKLFREYGRLGPFKGFIQHRKDFNNENNVSGFSNKKD